MSKRAELVVMAGLVVLLSLLAIGIGGLRMLPGQPFSLGSGNAPPAGTNGSLGPGSGVMLTVVQIIMIAVVAGIPLVIVYAIISREGRRKLIANLIIFGVLVAIILLLTNNSKREANPKDLSQGAAQAPPPDLSGSTQPSATFNPPTSDTLALAASLLLALVICGVLAFVLWRAWRKRHPAHDAALDTLTGQAQEALDSLRSGGDLRDVVLRCYREMSESLQRERGVQRPPAMTAREFERALQGKGVPLEPVRRLTDLFEQVRYGHESLGAQAEAEAIASLDALVGALRGAARDGSAEPRAPGPQELGA